MAAKRALPDGQPVEPPKLYLYAAEPTPDAERPTTLAWLVWLEDVDHGVSNAYFIDARSAGKIVHVEERTENARHRAVNDANLQNTQGVLVRSEGQGPSGIPDVNAAYDGTGATYDYYKARFGRDSYDTAGASMVSVVRVREQPGVMWRNAQWIGTRMRFGEGMTTLDITGHELTHAVVGKSAKLVYANESGALNESFSDIFGEMTERYARGSNDWEMGAGSPVGALRSMSDPTKYLNYTSGRPYPAHLRDYFTGCADHGGVHVNSSIQNKAFYNLAIAIGPDKAEQIFYRNLTQFLTSSSGFNDSRAGSIQAAKDLYGATAAEVVEVGRAWDSVGLDGVAQPPDTGCAGGGCFVSSSLSGQGMDDGGPDEDEVLATMYQIRDLVMPQSLAGEHYEDIYYENTARAAALVEQDEQLREQAVDVLEEVQPLAAALAEGEGDEIFVTHEMVVVINQLLDALAAADIANGGGALASVIATERAKVNLGQLEGLTLAEAVINASTQFANASQ